MKVLLNPKVDGNGRSLGQTGAELTEDIIRDLKLRAALLRVGRALAEQYRNYGNSRSDVVGVELHDISFSFILRERK